MDRYSSLDQSLSTVGAITTIGIKLSVLRFTIIVSLSNSPPNRSRRPPFSTVSKNDNLSNSALSIINTFPIFK